MHVPIGGTVVLSLPARCLQRGKRRPLPIALHNGPSSKPSDHRMNCTAVCHCQCRICVHMCSSHPRGVRARMRPCWQDQPQTANMTLCDGLMIILYRKSVAKKQRFATVAQSSVHKAPHRLLRHVALLRRGRIRTGHARGSSRDMMAASLIYCRRFCVTVMPYRRPYMLPKCSYDSSADESW